MLNLPKRINSSILYLTYNPLKETLVNILFLQTLTIAKLRFKKSC